MDDAQKISEAVGRVLAEVDRRVEERRPVCRASGRCCRFEEWGHRLYVTGAEMLHFRWMHGEGERTGERLGKEGVREGECAGKVVHLGQFFDQGARGCPYQVEGLCTAREGRPLGCRIYFCDETSTAWQEEVYEEAHAKLKEIHERFALPYRYVEWRAALREMMQSGEGGGG